MDAAICLVIEGSHCFEPRSLVDTYRALVENWHGQAKAMRSEPLASEGEPRFDVGEPETSSGQIGPEAKTEIDEIACLGEPEPSHELGVRIEGREVLSFAGISPKELSEIVGSAVQS
jgi:hypothetical protein